MNRQWTSRPNPTAVAGPSGVTVLQRKCACGGSMGPQGECEECQKKEQSLQRRAVGATGPALAPPIVHQVLRSPGRALDANSRSRMESHLGYDFTHVRVHADAAAAESARAVNALAYTVGSDVVFGAGQYAPEKPSGQKLLAHELAHVVQQRSATSASPQSKLAVGPADDPSEREAGRLAGGSDGPASSGPVRLQRAAACITEHAPDASVQPISPGLIVDDKARDLKPGQMRKSEFLDELRTTVCATADSALAAVGRSTRGCPYIERWIEYFRTRDSRHVERSIRKS